MNGAGGDPQHMRAYISPCISLENFEVGEEVARQFPNEFCDYVSWDKPHIDLKGFLLSELLEAGISERKILTSEYCTMEDTRFYSYRREKEKAGDRKSTRLNSSHVAISYAVFCLKKKKTNTSAC